MMSEHIEFKCFYPTWQVVTICVVSTFSTWSAILVLWVSWWLRLAKSRRLTIQRHRASTLVGFFIGFRLALLSCVLASHLLLLTAVVMVWCYLSHVSWTLMEGWQVYKALIKKEQDITLKEELSWIRVLSIYFPATVIVASVLIIKGSTFVPIILFYDFVFMGNNFTEFWEHPGGKSFLMFFLILPATIIMVIINLFIICLVLNTIRQRSEIFGAVSSSSQIAPSPKKAILFLTFSIVLGLNMIIGVLIFMPIALVAFVGRFLIMLGGIFFLGQFLLCNNQVRLALITKAPWIKMII